MDSNSPNRVELTLNTLKLEVNALLDCDKTSSDVTLTCKVNARSKMADLLSKSKSAFANRLIQWLHHGSNVNNA